ncbi:MAG: porin, partial [Hyphomicrobiales bacterium]|nr:porin [Hyphomicrobiales bacterium]
MKNLFLKRFFKLHVFLIINIIFNTQSFGASIYGRLDFSLNEINKFSVGSKTDAVSNSSRLGLKGKHTFDNGFSAIYQYETQIDPIDRSPNFKDRNSYIGLKGYFGKFIIGIHDTPVKQSQATVDLFNDTAGDIKNILWGENRSKKAAQWNSPKVKGLTLSTMLILEQGGEEAFSTNLMWQGKL